MDTVADPDADAGMIVLRCLSGPPTTDRTMGWRARAHGEIGISR